MACPYLQGLRSAAACDAQTCETGVRKRIYKENEVRLIDQFMWRFPNVRVPDEHPLRENIADWFDLASRFVPDDRLGRRHWRCNVRKLFAAFLTLKKKQEQSVRVLELA